MKHNISLRHISRKYAKLADKDYNCRDLYNQLQELPFNSSEWGSGSSDSQKIFHIGREIAEKVEWRHEHGYRLIADLCNYANDFSKYEYSEIYRTLYACYGYLSEYGDREFVKPIEAVMLAAYNLGKREMAARCAILLEEAGGSKYVAWAENNGLIRKSSVLKDFSGRITRL